MEVFHYTEDTGDWNSYLMDDDKSTFYHLIGWKEVVEKSFGHPSYYLACKDADRIVGILPLSLIRSKIFGTSLISGAFGDYGGVCAVNDEIKINLINRAKELAIELGADYLELRNLNMIDSCSLLADTRKATVILRLDNASDFLWKGLDQKARNQVRKANKSGLKIRFGGVESLSDFYEVFAHNMRDLGTPGYGFNFFKNIITIFPQTTELLLVELDGEVIGGAIATYFKNTMAVPWASSLRKYFHLCPNNLLYWEAIKLGCQKGYDYFDFCRSNLDSGSFQFKKQWGGTIKQLYYQYFLNNIKNIPWVSPSNPRYCLAVNIWRRLPLTLTKSMGPRIAKNLG